MKCSCWHFLPIPHLWVLWKIYHSTFSCKVSGLQGFSWEICSSSYQDSLLCDKSFLSCCFQNSLYLWLLRTWLLCALVKFSLIWICLALLEPSHTWWPHLFPDVSRYQSTLLYKSFLSFLFSLLSGTPVMPILFCVIVSLNSHRLFWIFFIPIFFYLSSSLQTLSSACLNLFLKNSIALFISCNVFFSFRISITFVMISLFWTSCFSVHCFCKFIELSVFSWILLSFLKIFIYNSFSGNAHVTISLGLVTEK